MDIYGPKNRSPDTLLSYNYCCVKDWEHYRIYLVHWQPPIIIEYEAVIIYDGKYKYQITQYRPSETRIVIWDIDAENRVIDLKEKKTTFSFNKMLFDFSNTTKEKILNRVKTILVFQ
jgi:hypothetical protein